MALWIMLYLELIIDCIILVSSPHSFACSLYLYSFFASEKIYFCTMDVLYFIFKWKRLFSTLLFSMHQSWFLGGKKRFTSFITMSSQGSFFLAHYFSGAESPWYESAAGEHTWLRNIRIWMEDKAIVFSKQIKFKVMKLKKENKKNVCPEFSLQANIVQEGRYCRS